MMKQPADNPNATPLEERQSAKRVLPNRDPTEEYEEIESEVRRLSAERGADDQISREDWDKAAEIVRNRKTARSKA
jgi:hypothetical protein